MSNLSTEEKYKQLAGKVKKSQKKIKAILADKDRDPKVVQKKVLEEVQAILQIEL